MKMCQIKERIVCWDGDGSCPKFCEGGLALSSFRGVFNPRGTKISRDPEQIMKYEFRIS